ncbi:MAG TPA: hypothetical protein VMA36_16555 [Candidatus Limnocylindria bacterium]|nr:hypothetical protein [Candidatus Limnocylindria bacterium]
MQSSRRTDEAAKLKAPRRDDVRAGTSYGAGDRLGTIEISPHPIHQRAVMFDLRDDRRMDVSLTREEHRVVEDRKTFAFALDARYRGSEKHAQRGELIGADDPGLRFSKKGDRRGGIVQPPKRACAKQERFGPLGRADGREDIERVETRAIVRAKPRVTSRGELVAPHPLV